MSNEKNIETTDCDQNHFTVFLSIDSVKCNTIFPAMFKCFNTVHEEDFIQPFKQVIYLKKLLASQTILPLTSSKMQTTWPSIVLAAQEIGFPEFLSNESHLCMNDVVDGLMGSEVLRLKTRIYSWIGLKNVHLLIELGRCSLLC